jgi:hypothetical protein
MAVTTQPIAPAAPQAQTRQRLVGLVLVLLAALLYAITLDTGLQPGELQGGDLITHQYAQVQARPSNAPGYPLYTMGGWLWFHGIRTVLTGVGVVAPNPLPILSSYSTLWALLALWFLYEIVCRITRSPRNPTGNWPLAALLSAFYAVTYFFWYYATTTEQYTSAIAQTLAIVYVYLLWEGRGARGEGQDTRGEGRGARDDNFTIHNSQFTIHNSPSEGRGARGDQRQDFLLLLLAFLCGLSLAHMLTVAFIVPPLVAVVLWTQPSLLRRPAMILAAIAAAFLPLLSYIYVYLRGVANPAWWGAGPWRDGSEWFWAFVSTAQGRDELSWGFQPTCAFFANDFPALIWGELSLPLLAIGVVGVALLPRRLPWMLYPTLAIYLVFDWMYRCGNWYQVILPAYPLLLLGAAALLDRLEGRLAASRAPWLRWLVALSLVAAIAWRGASSWPRADSRDRAEDTALDAPALLLDQPLPANAALFAAVDDALGLDYLINIWGVRPDLRMVSSTDAATVLRNGQPLLTTLAAAPVLLAELPPDLNPARQLVSPDWLALSLAPTAPPTAIATPLDLPVAGGATLLGYRVAPAPDGEPVASAPPAVDVTLHWALADGWPAGLGVSLRPTRDGAFFTDAAGAIVQRDAGAPAQGLATGARVDDMLRVPLPEGADGITLIVYRATDAGFDDLLEIGLELPSASSGDAQ